MLSYIDVFLFLAVLAMAAIPFVFLLKKRETGRRACRAVGKPPRRRSWPPRSQAALGRAPL